MTYILPNDGPFDWSKDKFPSKIPSWTYSQGNPVLKPVAAPKLAEAFKPKKAGTKSSHSIFVLDDSGSMRGCREATISGYNEYLDVQRKNAEIPTFVSLYKFDGQSLSVVHNRVPVAEAPDLNKESYNPQGTTNLYDAIGGVLMAINTDLSSRKKSDRDSVMICILTDGQENSSRTFDSVNIKQMVEKSEGKNWGFMFLGANIDAFATGAEIGFGTHNTLQYNTSSMEGTMRSASAMTTRLSTNFADGLDVASAYAESGFTDAERNAAVTPDDK